MRLWIFLLRFIGLLVFLVGVLLLVADYLALSRVMLSVQDAISLAKTFAESTAIAVLCFGAASALTTLQRVDQRITRATGARQRAQIQPKNLAPDAPGPSNTEKYLVEGERRNRGMVRRIDQNYYTYRTPSSKRAQVRQQNDQQD